MENLMTELKGVVGDLHLLELIPSFVASFFLELPPKILFIVKRSGEQVTQLNDCLVDSPKSDSFAELDVTGSPLNFTEYSLRLEDTIVKKYWSEEEEKYLPIPLNNARGILSKYLTRISNPCVPLWVFCDGFDKSRTFLLSAFKENGWISRTFVRYKGLLSLSAIEELVDNTISPSQNVQVHCLFSLTEDENNDITFEMTQNGVIFPKFIKMLVKLQWQKVSVKLPREGVSAFLAMELKVGQKSSAIYSLWSQLNIICSYFEQMEDLTRGKQSAVLNDDRSSEKKLLQNISKRIFSFMNRENKLKHLPGFSVVENSIPPYKSGVGNIVTELTKVLSCNRPGCDVTEKMWLLFNELADAKSVADCINTFLSDLGDCKSYDNLRNDTLLSSICIAHQKGIVTEISSKMAMEIMIQTGMQKLKEDYIYLFMKLGVECSNLFKNIPLSIIKSFDVVEHNMKSLAQLHVALDFILGAQFYFDMTDRNLSIFAQNVVEKCCQTVSSFKMLQNNPNISLEVPVNIQNIINLLPSKFQTLKLLSSSRNDEVRDYSVLLLTPEPVFPPTLTQLNIENQLQDEASFMEPQYHVYEMSSFYDILE